MTLFLLIDGTYFNPSFHYSRELSSVLLALIFSKSQCFMIAGSLKYFSPWACQLKGSDFLDSCSHMRSIQIPHHRPLNPITNFYDQREMLASASLMTWIPFYLLLLKFICLGFCFMVCIIYSVATPYTQLFPCTQCILCSYPWNSFTIQANQSRYQQQEKH